MGSWESGFSPLRGGSPGGRPWVIGHRGAAALEPENTMRSFRRALELGADLVECDVHLSSDGQLVVIHDDTLDRTTDGQGPVAGRSAEELRSLDAGAGERIPTLDELLAWLRAQPRAPGVAVEIKPARADEALAESLARAVAAAVDRHAMRARAIAISFDEGVLARVKLAAPALATGLLVASRPAESLARALALRCECLLPGIHLLGPALVLAAHERGLGIFTWTANSPAEIVRALSCGVDGIASDAPERVREVAGGARPPASGIHWDRL